MKKRKALRRLKKMRRAGVRAWKKRRACKWQTGCVLLLVSALCMSSYREPGSWQEICISKEDFIKKERIQEQYELEKSGNSEETKEPVTKNPILNEGAALFLKEGKLLFFRIREEEKQKRPTD